MIQSQFTPAAEEEDWWRVSISAEWTPDRLVGNELIYWFKADKTFVDETGATYALDLSGNGRHLRLASPASLPAKEVKE